MTGRKKKSPGKWIDRIADSVGKFVTLETRSGVSREGKISALRTETVEFNGSDCELPIAIELNGDVFDTVDLVTIQRINID